MTAADPRPGADAALAALDALPADASDADRLDAVYNPIAVAVLGTQAQALALNGYGDCGEALAIRASAYQAGDYDA